MQKRVGDISIEWFEDSDTVIVRKHCNDFVTENIRLTGEDDLGDLQYAISCIITLMNRAAQRR
jgi:hypothetical protein